MMLNAHPQVLVLFKLMEMLPGVDVALYEDLTKLALNGIVHVSDLGYLIPAPWMLPTYNFTAPPFPVDLASAVFQLMIFQTPST